MTKTPCQVYFIGAGPGDPELLTIKGKRIIQEAALVLYTGSLVPREVVADVRMDAKIMDSSSMTLQETHALIQETFGSGGIVARVHTGDPSLYGALREQMLLLDQDNIPYEVVPGVTAAFAAAAAARVSFTLPEESQTLIITRMAGRTPVPEKESLRSLAAHGTAMAIYLSASNPEGLVEDLLKGGLPEDTPVVIAHRVGWPDQSVIPTTLARLTETVREARIDRQAVFLVLPGQDGEPVFSKLYSPDFSHGHRRGRP